jgi:hypothetical protein
VGGVERRRRRSTAIMLSNRRPTTLASRTTMPEGVWRRRHDRCNRGFDANEEIEDRDLA